MSLYKYFVSKFSHYLFRLDSSVKNLLINLKSKLFLSIIYVFFSYLLTKLFFLKFVVLVIIDNIISIFVPIKEIKTQNFWA